MVKLNLPACEYKVKEADGKVWIFDGIRKKFVVLTPEEWVRQHFIQYLINQLGYPKSLIKVETGLMYNRLTKRSDIVIFNREGKPWMLVECKAPDVALDENATRQLSVYNKTLNARYAVLTNGMKHFCFDMADDGQSLKELPTFD